MASTFAKATAGKRVLLALALSPRWARTVAVMIEGPSREAIELVEVQR